MCSNSCDEKQFSFVLNFFQELIDQQNKRKDHNIELKQKTKLKICTMKAFDKYKFIQCKHTENKAI